MSSKLEISKFPLLEQQIKELAENKRLIDLLNVRKSLILQNSGKINPYELNEQSILEIETNKNLAKVHSQVNQSEHQIKSIINYFTEKLAEMENGVYEKTIETAETQSKKNKKLLTFISQYDRSDLDADLSKKIHFFISLRNFISPPKIKK